MNYDYDLYTIGAGSGGVRASRRAAALGAKVAVAEARFFGGTCVNVGCVPKKLLVYGAGYGDALRQAAGFGWRTSFGNAAAVPEHAWAPLMEGQRAEVARLNRVYADLLKTSGCDVHWGRARLVDAHTVEVEAEAGPKQYTAKHILLATGGQPVRPDTPGAELAWVSDDVFFAEKKPERLVVVGGGYIALEMASIFAGLGSQVTLVHRGAHTLRGFDDDARTFLCQEMGKRGIDFRMNTSVVGMSKGDNGVVAMLDRALELEADAVLYAIGRMPNVAGLGLEEAGVRMGKRGVVEVNDAFQTSVPSIYAVGDVTGKGLTPVALAEGSALAAGLFGGGLQRPNYDTLPTAVFTTPPLASVGLTEAQARARLGMEPHVYSTGFKPLKHALSGADHRSFMKIVVDPDSDRVLGVHIVGEDGPEMIQGVAVAMTAGATKRDFDNTIGLHPTAAEELVTMRERQPDA